jgi:hypothetical protein
LIELFYPHLPAVPDPKGSRFQKRFQFQSGKITRNFGCPWMPTDDMNLRRDFVQLRGKQEQGHDPKVIHRLTTISVSHELVTLINVFTVEPANQQQLLELLARLSFSCMLARSS